jgi:transcriptional regulator with XRE-family HTH domain
MTARDRKAELVRNGVTQAEIARRTGFSLGYVGDVIAGNRRSPKIQSAIAEAIGRPVREVFGDLAVDGDDEPTAKVA